MRDKDLARHLKDIQKAKEGKVRGAVLNAGVELALDGYPLEATALFGLAEGEKHPHESVYLDGAIVGLRVALGLDTSEAARTAAASADERVRTDLLRDRWTQLTPPAPAPGLPPAVLDTDAITEWFRRALLADDEARRREILQDLVARPDLPRYFRADALLLVADAQARAGDPGAVQVLATWREQTGSFSERALALAPVAKLIAAGSLRAWSKLTQAGVDAFLEQARAAAGAARPSTPSKYVVTTLYNQFYLEPQRPSEGMPGYFEDPQDVARGYSLRGDRVALSTPTEAEACEVALHVAAPPKKIAGADMVVDFPLEVAGDLYLRSVDDGSDDHRWAVPPGRYAVTVAFKQRKPRKGAGLDRYTVDVWLATT